MKKFNFLNKILLTTILASSFSLQAEVTKQSSNSFTIKHSFVSDAKKSTVKHEFGHVGRWWASEFTQSGKGQNMFFNSKGMHEKMPSGKMITHLTRVDKGVWNGALGELRNNNVDGEMIVSIKNFRHGTKITMEYTVKSELLADHHHWPKSVDTMLSVQMDSLNSSLKKRMNHIREILQ
jgi:hypothetical protein